MRQRRATSGLLCSSSTPSASTRGSPQRTQAWRRRTSSAPTICGSAGGGWSWRSGRERGRSSSDPSNGEAYVALCRAYRIKGWLREEFQLWQRRAQIDPSDATVSERVGWVLWFTGRAAESLPWLRTAVAQRPEGRWGHFFLGNANLAL